MNVVMTTLNGHPVTRLAGSRPACYRSVTRPLSRPVFKFRDLFFNLLIRTCPLNDVQVTEIEIFNQLTD